MSMSQTAARFRRALRIPSSILNSSLLAGRTTDSGCTMLFPRKAVISRYYGSGGYTWKMSYRDAFQWIFLSGHAVLFLGLSFTPALADGVSIERDESDTSATNLSGLRKIEDGSVVSNIHTSKWRVFTDNARDFFLKGKLEDAERLFVAALKEAKEGFGERDPHVASSCNNLAELYRVKKAFDKAEPLYLEAINVLEESYGPDDIRVGAALHNLGQFYLVQRKLENARACYERALKIKRRILGEGHTEYADAMYHLGQVLYLQGNEKDSEALIQDSIRVLEESGQGESSLCIRRLRSLVKMYVNSNRLTDAVNVQRKILHTLETSKGWDSLDTVIAAEGLALTLQSAGSLSEAQELLERCLDSRKILLSEDHIQIAANMLHIAKVEMLKVNQLGTKSQVATELDKAKDLLCNVLRIARHVLDKLMKQKGNPRPYGVSRTMAKDEHIALLILLQAHSALGQLEIMKVDSQKLGEDHMPLSSQGHNALDQCIASFKEFENRMSVPPSPEIKAAYLSCLRLLSGLLSATRTQQSGRATLHDVQNEIKRVEGELPSQRKHID